MRCITKDLAAQMEGCIKQTHIEVTKLYPQGKILNVNGGAACFSGSDSYLSQVVGWGFTTEPKQFKSEIEGIEQFYLNQSHGRVDIELCPYVGNELTLFLSKRGYQVTELNNVSALCLKEYVPFDYHSEPFEIKEVPGAQLDEWATRVAVGFGYPDAREQFFQYVQANGVKAFAAYDKGKVVAGAVIAVYGDFCDLGVTSTLPIYRGKGLQKKLLQARLNFAKKLGLSWAIVTTEPGTVSDANIQKIGFRCAYTRVKMTCMLD
ncbi:GNAT family N-acetyltransferase [Legionella saoudiensis]|uniref:GNAT family N-acetyltransferase n=1 Tax=Legionella saoudiensis TaxID=1750561 RepID=UPI000730C33B|nr:GNAT family N-acetyltransferase [Legionella saoudiensis]